MKTLVILEMANNHMGSISHAKKIIKGFHYITRKFTDKIDFALKFQYRDRETFIHKSYKQSESDFVKRLAANDKKASSVIISEIMSSNFRWVEPETELEDAIQKMLNNNIRRLVILDDGKLVGVITQTDLTGFLRDKLLVDKTIQNIQKN